MIIITHNKQGNLKAKYNQHSYRIYLDKNRYYFNVNKVPVYCTKEVNKFIKKGGNHDLSKLSLDLGILPSEAQDKILSSLTKETIENLSLTTKENRAVVMSFWNKILSDTFLVFFTLRSKILKNDQLKNEIIQKLENIIGHNYGLIMRQPITISEEEEHEKIQNKINQAQLKVFSLQHPELHTFEKIVDEYRKRYD